MVNSIWCMFDIITQIFLTQTFFANEINVNYSNIYELLQNVHIFCGQ